MNSKFKDVLQGLLIRLLSSEFRYSLQESKWINRLCLNLCILSNIFGCFEQVISSACFEIQCSGTSFKIVLLL